MKTVKSLEKILDKAYEQAQEKAADKHEYVEVGMATLKRKGEGVYQVQVTSDGEALTLYHYGSMILQILSDTNVRLGSKAHSASDRNAIYTTLKWRGLDENYKVNIQDGTLTLWKRETKFAD